jgi:hypothetical protein
MATRVQRTTQDGDMITTTIDPVSGLIVTVERTRMTECDAPECVAEQARFRRIWPSTAPCYGNCEWGAGPVADSEGF